MRCNLRLMDYASGLRLRGDLLGVWRNRTSAGAIKKTAIAAALPSPVSRASEAPASPQSFP